MRASGRRKRGAASTVVKTPRKARAATKGTRRKGRPMRPEDDDRKDEAEETEDTETEETGETGETGDTDESEDTETEDTETDEAGDTETDEAGDTDEGGEAEDGADGRKAELGKRAQRRIGQLTGKVKDLERQLGEARALAGDDGRALIAAAESAGVLPGLMSRDEAKGFAELDSKTSVAKYLRKLLRSDDDEFEIDGRTRSRRWVEGELDDINDELAELRERYGARRAELAGKTRKVLELGMAALKEGWQPGKGVARTKKEKGAPAQARRPAKRSVPGKKEKAGRGTDWGAVTDEASAEAMILAELEE